VISINSTNKIRTYKIYGIVGALLTLAIPYFIMILQVGNIEKEQSLCPFKMATGFPCPGCGITKSMIFLYQGDVVKSLYYHVFGPIVVLFCFLTIIVLLFELFTKKELFYSIIYNKKIAYIMGFILAIYHLIRLVIFISNNNIQDILQQSIWQ
jgi:hypothetical protein